MAFNHTLSAILRGTWLLDKQWADAQMPMILSFLKGEAIDFGTDERTEDSTPQLLSTNLAKSVNIYSVRPYTDIQDIPQGSLVMVSMSGPMVKRGGYCSYGMTDQAQLISRLSKADNIDGIILNIDSPGGEASGTAMLSDAIKNASQRKPIVAIIDDGMAASAAMWIASAASEIYVTQATDQVGSIGVYTKIADWNSYYKDALKLNVQDIYAPQSTDKNKDYRDAISGNTTAVEEDLSVLADQFISSVARNRSGKIKGDSWKTGKMFYAKDAVKIGLIDGIKTFDQVVNRMIQLNKNSQQTNSSNMAFKKIISAAKAESFAVVEGGFLLEENHLNNIETALDAADASRAALVTANASLSTVTEELNSLKTTNETANSTISTQAAKIVELEAKVAALGKKPSGKGTVLTTEKDESAEGDQMPVYLDDASPENEWFDKQVKYR